MVGGQLSLQMQRARRREEHRRIGRQYYTKHRDECRTRERNRRKYINQIIQQIELNDDPESLLYAGNFEEYFRSYKKKGA